MASKITVGVIGAGRIGKIHIANMKSMDQVRVKIVSDVSANMLQDWFQNSGVEQITTDYRDVIYDPEVEAVFICSPRDTHIPIIKEVAKEGKHVFCEKPIGFSDEETIEAYEVFLQTGVKYQSGFNRRYDRNF